MSDYDELKALAQHYKDTNQPDKYKQALIKLDAIPSQDSSIGDLDKAKDQQDRRANRLSATKATAQKKDDLEEAKRQEVEGVPEIGDHPYFSFMSIGKDGVKLNPQGVGKGRLPLAFGYLSMPDDEFAAVVQENIPGSTVRQTELGNFIVDTEDGEYTLNRPGISMRDVQSLAFKAGAATPAGFTRFAGPKAVGVVAGQEVLTEAGVQGLEAAAGGEFTPEDVGVAGLGGFVGQSVGEVASMAGRGAAGQMTEQAQEIIDVGRETGTPVLTSDLVEQGRLGKFMTEFAEAVPVAGTGRRRMKQKRAREGLAEKIRDQYGESSPDAVYESLINNADRVKKAAGRARGAIVDQVNEVQIGNNAIAALDEQITKMQFLPNGKPRQTVDTAVLGTLQNFRADIAADPTFRNLDGLRTSFRTAVKGDTTKRLGNREEAAIGKVYDAMTKDMDDVVENTLTPNDFRKWKKSNAAYFAEAQKLNNNRLKAVLNGGEIGPDKAAKMLRSKDPAELKILYRSLDTKGRRNAKAAIIFDAAEKATDDSGVINPKGFAGNLRKADPAIDVFFRDKEKDALKGYRKLLATPKRGQDFNVTTPTGQMLYGGAVATGYYLDPLVAGLGITTGLFSSLYETPMGRDFLIKLANTPPGSTRFDRLVRENGPVINALAATLAKEIDQE